MPDTKTRSDYQVSGAPGLIYFLPAILWLALICYFSLIPGPELPQILGKLNDKLLHLLIYMLAVILIYLGFLRYKFRSTPDPLALKVSFWVAVILGLIVELLQHFWVANRFGDGWDLLANLAGSLLAVLLIRTYSGYKA